MFLETEAEAPHNLSMYSAILRGSALGRAAQRTDGGGYCVGVQGLL